MRNKSETKLNPKPGSEAAQQAGCTCPVMDNHYGAGRGGDGKTYGWYERGSCTIHGFGEPEPAPKPKTERKKFGFAPVQAPAYLMAWRPSTNPKGPVEKFLVTDFLESGERAYSEILAGWEVRKERRFRCPKCNQLLDPPPDGQGVHHGCGVSFCAYGNGLEVWKTWGANK